MLIDQRIKSYQDGAIKRDRRWTLTNEQALELIKGDCYYCGSPAFPMNGIDRIDNARGYTPGNCVSCCKDCNFGKGTKTIDEFLEWIDRVQSHIRK